MHLGGLGSEKGVVPDQVHDATLPLKDTALLRRATREMQSHKLP